MRYRRVGHFGVCWSRANVYLVTIFLYNSRHMMRSHRVDELTQCASGASVTLAGWVHRRRDHGPIMFIDLRNRTDVVQIVVRLKDFSVEDQERIKDGVRPESVIQVVGAVTERRAGTENPDLSTGRIEIVASGIVVLNQSATPPFVIDDPNLVAGEEVRLTYRYLDLRREKPLKNMLLRNTVIQAMRRYLLERDFIEVETPILSKSTPEGARDYLVPDRRRPGQFYALPQSPQQYKQLLMVAGLERYFQIVRCFRDEDTRGDRQPEFTQLDIEMSFIEQEDMLQLIEALYIHLVQTCAPDKRIQQIPFPRLTYKEAAEKYGSDKPDLREDKNDPNLLAFCFVLDFPMFERKDDGSLGAVHHPFTKPRVANAEELRAVDPLTILADQYDFVLNGYEIGGGSIRTHDPELLAAVFEVLGHTSEEVERQFGHLLKAFRYGVPPHGGIAPGIDRFLMLLANEPNIREVIAFPKTGDGRDLMMDAPSVVSAEQLKELGLSVRE